MEEWMTAGIDGKLLEALTISYPELGITRLDLAGEGLDFLVFRASRAGDALAVKTPRSPVFFNDNDGHVSPLSILKQEAFLSQHAGVYGIPVPDFIVLHESEFPFPFLVQQFIDTDSEEPPPQSLGDLVGRIHGLPVPTGPLVAETEPSLPSLLAERMLRRSSVVVRKANISLCLPRRRQLEELLESYERPRSLLHMDARPANVLTRAGKIQAVVDWANALVGDPQLELARIAEYGYLTRAFLDAYRAVRVSVDETPRPLELVYRLDTALMLSVVFLSEKPDVAQASRQLTRVLRLASELQAYIRGT